MSSTKKALSLFSIYFIVSAMVFYYFYSAFYTHGYGLNLHIMQIFLTIIIASYLSHSINKKYIKLERKKFIFYQITGAILLVLVNVALLAYAISQISFF